MTRDDIIRMATESQQESSVSNTGTWFVMEVKDLQRFADFVLSTQPKGEEK